VRAINHAFALGNFVDAVDKNRALLLQFLHDKPVVDDLLAYINWPPKRLQRDPDNIDRPHHPGAESPRLQQQ